jgi:type IV pilus assembly protein PilC
MGMFAYDAVDRAGVATSGTLHASDRPAAIALLRSRGLVPMRIEQRAAEQPGASLVESERPGLWGRIMPGGGEQIEIGLYQIAVMTRNGVNILTALRTVAAQTPYVRLRQIWLGVADRVQSGSSLSQALTDGRRFNRLVVQMVKVGEQTGELDKVLTRTTVILRKRREILNQQITAMGYPVVVLLAAFAISGWMVVGVIPALAKFLRTVGRKLPAITQALVDVSTVVTTNLPLVIIVLVALVGGIVVMYRYPPTRLVMDRLVLCTPVVGPALRTAASALFARSMAVFLRSGVRVVDGLGTLSALHSNRWLGQIVDRARTSVLRGAALAPSLRAPQGYTGMLTGMIGIGEQSGALDEVLDEVANYHEFHLEQLLKRVSTVFEIVTILVVGGIVGFVYIAFFVALFAAG